MKSRLLVVDDEESLLFTIGDYFETRGYLVDFARDLDEVLDLLGQKKYAAAIVDLRLRGSSDTGGLEVLEAVRASDPETRRMLLTSYGSPEVEREARRLGVDAYLLKPLPLPQLAQLVDSMLDAEQRGERKQN